MKQIIAVLVVVVVAGGAWWYLQGMPTGTPAPTNVPASKDDLIIVTSPLPNIKITSPLTITGKARGGWYFEASFPVKIYDANGKELGQVAAQAQGDWMTTEYVPFVATLTFDKPTTATGKLVLQKDNPSGLPENENQLEIPVTF